jgi:ribosomal protein S27AE
MVRVEAPTRWRRQCADCGWVDPTSFLSGARLAEVKYADDHENKFDFTGPRCGRCGSENLEVLAARD